MILTLVCAFGLVACSNAEPETIQKTSTGEITSIALDEEVLTMLDEKTNEEIRFSIALLMSDSRGLTLMLKP